MELPQKLEKLRSLETDLHLFCPRQGSEDQSCYFVEDIADGNLKDENSAQRAQREAKIHEADERCELVLDCMAILAFHADDASEYQHWLKKRIEDQMQSCDVCVRVYHRSREVLRNRLVADFDEEDVATFMETVDRFNYERIVRGLDSATKTLTNLPEKSRTLRSLKSDEIFAFFEALSCEPFLRDEATVKAHFDAPFELVQTRKPLKIRNYPPAVEYFIFSTNELRNTWALQHLQSVDRDILSAEFENGMRWPLSHAMKRVQMENLDTSFLPRFWVGLRLIVDKLSADLITHSLRGMDVDPYKLTLEHLHLDFQGFENLVATLQQLVEKTPRQYWDSMGAISPTVIIQQFCHSPSLGRALMSMTEDETSPEFTRVKDLFAWTRPFLHSIAPSNLSPACRILAGQLLGALQSPKFPQVARSFCKILGLEHIDNTLRRLSARSDVDSWVGAATVAEVIDVVKEHVGSIIADIKLVHTEKKHNQAASQLALAVMRHAFGLDYVALSIHNTLLKNKKQVEQPTDALSSSLWDITTSTISAGNVALGLNTLSGWQQVVSVEKFESTGGLPLTTAMRRFNDTLDKVSGFITQVIESLADIPPATIEATLAERANATLIVVPLFSYNSDTRQSVIELFKSVSSQGGRHEAIAHLLTSKYVSILGAVLQTVKLAWHKKTFAPMPSSIKLLKDIVDIMCNSQDGILRSRKLTDEEGKTSEEFWQMQWRLLAVIFDKTEEWSNSQHKEDMMEFCRDTMEFADYLFDQHAVFASALADVAAEGADKKEIGRRLIHFPKSCITSAVRWLRLRDEYLCAKSVSLITGLLTRLRDAHLDIPTPALHFVCDIISGTTKSKLSGQQKAGLQRALGIDEPDFVDGKNDKSPSVEQDAKPAKQTSMADWVKQGTLAPTTKPAQSQASKRLSDAVEGPKPASGRPAPSEVSKPARGRESSKTPALLPGTTRPPPPKLDALSFKQRRDAEKEAKKKRDALAVAQAKKNIPGASQTSNAGPALAGLGVAGKDHSAKRSRMMVSDNDTSEEDDDEALDRELFGIQASKRQRTASGYQNVRAEAQRNLLAPQVPVKKQRQARSAKDMRARLAPDLSGLHRQILGWDYFHQGDFPPNSRPEMYSRVPNSFHNPVEYQQTFGPLLFLEAWQGFVKAREENNLKAFDIKVISRSSVDAFFEVGTTMTHEDNKEVMISDGDIVLFSESEKPTMTKEAPHCLARVARVTRKKSHMEVLYKVLPATPLLRALHPNMVVFGAKVQSITPLEREYGALQALQYYDLCAEIVRAKPSPLLQYSDRQLSPIMGAYSLNKAQAKAVKSALDNDAFTLIQGPPGSGKTKTIVALVGALLTDLLNREKAVMIQRPRFPGGRSSPPSPPPPKKLLVCAPSNAAVDELVMRFKEGIKTTTGLHRKINVVRIGRSDAINANIRDVMLDELVNKELERTTGGAHDAREKTQKLMKEHQAVSEALRDARDRMDLAEGGNREIGEEIGELKRRKAALSTQIDNARDAETTACRDADISRKRAQQKILDETHVLCATLSGSGHDMFQNLNVDFETVVVDEAAQCVEMSALIPLKYGCAKCILVGDPKQLPPTVFSKEAAKFQYEQSLFVRMQGNHPNDVHLLDTQYRMHPDISTFPSQTFYDGRLLDGPRMAKNRKRIWHCNPLLGPYRFFDVKGQHQSTSKGHSLINVAEVHVALQLYDRLIQDFGAHENFSGKIGIITPYKSQLRELKNRFSARYGREIFDIVEFNTTDAFQGRESEIIIFSCVRASPAGGIGFLQDIRRMNVGLTRAKSSLLVLGNSQSLVRGDYWRKLVENSKTRNCYTSGNLMNLLSQKSVIPDELLPRSDEDVEMRSRTNSTATPPGDKSAASSGKSSARNSSPKKSPGLGASSSSGPGAKNSSPPTSGLSKESPTSGPSRKRSTSEMLAASDEDVVMKDGSSPAGSAPGSEPDPKRRKSIDSSKAASSAETSPKMESSPSDEAQSPQDTAQPPKRPLKKRKKSSCFIDNSIANKARLGRR
ncbi:SEN1 N terminal-domain-containing protein [Lineolata rhizophorae]|uniref:SEN1 N terminal-domain-containing protein n=1 Tax=Lineolata rhizophorae TaxID=578093 RepID=A0A6A6P239_9PEZI|nr:SEN1 N terminal-domain-containing protein [Lineolata rhizophorae]